MRLNGRRLSDNVSDRRRGSAGRRIGIGGGIAGPFGMLFAVPVFSSAYELLREATIAKEAALAPTAHT